MNRKHWYNLRRKARCKYDSEYDDYPADIPKEIIESLSYYAPWSTPTPPGGFALERWDRYKHDAVWRGTTTAQMVEYTRDWIRMRLEGRAR